MVGVFWGTSGVYTRDISILEGSLNFLPPAIHVDGTVYISVFFLL